MKFLFLFLCAWVLAARVSAQHLKPALIQTMAGEKVGYQRGTTVVLNPRYDEGDEFDQDGLAVVAIGGLHGVIDSTGKVVIPLKYKSLSHFYEGLASVSLDGRKVGFLNKAGVLAIPCTYDDAGDFHEGVVTVIRGNKCALLSKKNVLLTLFKYQRIEAMQGGIARVCLKNDSRESVYQSHFWGFLDAQGHEISALDNYGYESPNLTNGYAVARRAKLDVLPANLTARQRALHAAYIGQTYTYSSALIDKTGRVVIPASTGYEFGNWGDDYIIVKRGAAYGAVSMTGKVLLSVGFHAISKFEYGPPDKPLARVATSADGQFFYVDEHWQPTEYDGVKPPAY